MINAIRYSRVISGGEVPCSRCGKDARLFLEGDDSVLMLDGEAPICRGCRSLREEIEHGERLLAGLRKRDDEIRRDWLGGDYDEVQTLAGAGQVDEALRLVQTYGSRPAELEECCRMIEELEDLLEDMRFEAAADPRLLPSESPADEPD